MTEEASMASNERVSGVEADGRVRTPCPTCSGYAYNGVCRSCTESDANIARIRADDAEWRARMRAHVDKLQTLTPREGALFDAQHMLSVAERSKARCLSYSSHAPDCRSCARFDRVIARARHDISALTASAPGRRWDELRAGLASEVVHPTSSGSQGGIGDAPVQRCLCGLGNRRINVFGDLFLCDECDGAVDPPAHIKAQHVHAAGAEVGTAHAADGARAVLAPAGHAVEGQPDSMSDSAPRGYRVGDRVEVRSCNAVGHDRWLSARVISDSTSEGVEAYLHSAGRAYVFALRDVRSLRAARAYRVGDRVEVDRLALGMYGAEPPEKRYSAATVHSVLPDGRLMLDVDDHPPGGACSPHEVTPLSNANCLRCGGPAYVGLTAMECMRDGGCAVPAEPEPERVLHVPVRGERVWQAYGDGESKLHPIREEAIRLWRAERRKRMGSAAEKWGRSRYTGEQ
jgi:hypothetical protein